ncbi:enamine deaminase RidA [Brevibacillus choshinensis]|uniref:Enamine deaminase RidA n=1 Tax=Brevibacillus choshinensis TaxID=54911 RepID=A0ABR5N5W1_BRECH|nr:RidA family protein [Brevibacillus choshinensis]KQL46008.1 enamine deaminase RidA [Brevibacillus choshinensis]
MPNEKQITFINPETMPKSFGYSHVVEAIGGRTIYISGQVPLNKEGQIVGEGDLAAQTKQVFENIKAALDAVGASFHDVVKLTFFVTDITQMQTVRDIRDAYVNTEKPPASSAVEIRKLINEAFLIEIEAIAVANAR